MVRLRSDIFLVSLVASLSSIASASFATLRPSRTKVEADLTTPPPNPPIDYDLRIRAKSSFSLESLCGVSGTVERVCNDGSPCKATILANSRAYRYCSQSGVAIQNVQTTGIGDWPRNKPCPSSSSCCFAPASVLQTNLFITDGYTVTAWECGPRPLTRVFSPYPNFLNPASFSASLKQEGITLSRSGGSRSSAASASTSLTGSAAQSSSGGLSSGAKIGLGAGLGAGLGVALICAIAFLFWRRHEKKKNKTPAPLEVATSQPPRYQTPSSSTELPTPISPFSPQMTFNPGRSSTQYTSPQWSSPPQWSPEDGYYKSESMDGGYLRRTETHEMPEQPVAAAEVP